MANGSIRLDADFSQVSREVKKVVEEFNGLDKGLHQASNAVNGVIDDFNKAGKSMTTMDNKTVALAGALGKIDTSAKSPRKSLSELKKILEETTVSYNRLTDQEKASPFGKALKGSIDELTQRAKVLKHELSEVNRTLSETKAPSLPKGGGFGGFNFGGMAGGALKFAGALGAVTSAATLASNAITNNVETAKNFEKSMSSLASLTGLGGDTLDTLKRKAIEMGANTTQSATQAADAMAMIGSKRPDLLNSAYALADVTQSAITLSEAAGMEVPDAAEALSAALNIFQMESSEATRVINVLAAGSKKGAAGIQELGDIVFRAGGSAKKAGLSFEEFAGAAEIIRPAFGTAEDAGQAFNKFLQMLESKMDSQYKPSVVGFEQAMRNLKDANLGSTESVKLFTINGVKAYDAIMANVDGLGEMIKGVTGTNTAFEQASQNTDNFQGSMDSLSSAWEGFNLAINSSNGALKTMVDWLTDCVTWATNTFTELGRIKAKMDEINGVKENGPTRVDKDVRYVKNAQGNTPEEKKADAERRKATVNRNLDSQIKPLEEFVKAYNEADGKKLAQLRKTYKQIGDRSYNSIKAEAEALKQVRGEFNARADEYIKGIGKKPTTETTTTTTSTTSTSATKTKVEKTEEQQNTESIRKLTEEYIKATDERKEKIREEIKALQERNDELKRLSDEAQGIIKPLRKDEQATYTITVDKSQLDALKKELPEDVTIVETVKVDAPASVEIPVNVEQPEAVKVDAPASVEIPVNVEQPEPIKIDVPASVEIPKPVKVDAPDRVEITITAETSQIDKSVNDILRRYDGVKREVESKPMQMQVGLSGASQASIQATIEGIKSELSKAELGTDLYVSLTTNLADATTFKNVIEQWVNAGLNLADIDTESLFTKILDGDNIPDSTWEDLVKKINEELASRSLDPIKLDVTTGKIPTDRSSGKNQEKDKNRTLEGSSRALSGVSGIQSGLNALGIDLGKGFDDTIKVMQGILAVAQGIQAVQSAIQLFSTANDTTQTGLLADIAANTAIAAAGSWVPFAEGGLPSAASGRVFGGHQYTDQITARVSSGEMVINEADQKRLYDDIHSGNLGGGGSAQPHVTGEMIYLGMNNFLKRTGKGEIVTSRR